MYDDFGFPEKGIYRYLVTEDGRNVAVITVDYTNQELVKCENYPAEWYKLPFGINPAPRFEDFLYYMTTRIVSAAYDGIGDLYDKFKPEKRNRYQLLLAMKGRVATDNLEVREEALDDPA